MTSPKPIVQTIKRCKYCGGEATLDCSAVLSDGTVEIFSCSKHIDLARACQGRELRIEIMRQSLENPRNSIPLYQVRPHTQRAYKLTAMPQATKLEYILGLVGLLFAGLIFSVAVGLIVASV